MKSLAFDVSALSSHARELGHLEAVKWVACALMLVEHYFRFVVGTLPIEIFALGRAVFPMFALSLAFGIAGASIQSQARVAVRLFAWAVIAGLAGAVVRDAFPVNVLATLGLGILAYLSMRVGSLIALLACVLAGLLVEFGPAGVISVAVFCVAAGLSDIRLQLIGIFVATAVLVVPNGVHAALVGLPIVIFLRCVNVRVPRVRRIFYWVYALQWPAFWCIRELI